MLSEIMKIIIGGILRFPLWFTLGLVSFYHKPMNIVYFFVSLLPFTLMISIRIHYIPLSTILFIIPCIVIQSMGKAFYNREPE